MAKQIVLFERRPPLSEDLDSEIGWLCGSLGVVSGRDVDRTAREVFMQVLLATKSREPLTSDMIARRLNLTRGAINHHLRWLIDAGLLVRHQRELALRGPTLERTILELRRDAERMFEDIIEMAVKIDERI